MSLSYTSPLNETQRICKKNIHKHEEGGDFKKARQEPELLLPSRPINLHLLLLLAICSGSLAPSSRSSATHEDLLPSIFPPALRKVTFMDGNNHLSPSALSFLLQRPRQTCLNLLALSHEAAELVQKCLGSRA